MPYIMSYIGYNGEIVEMSRSFAAVASISQIVDYCSGTFSSLLEVEGYARFNAIYDFWESTLGLLICYIFIVYAKPNLFALGLFHGFLDIISTLYYLYLTYEKRGLFESYLQGFIAPVRSWVSNSCR